ncbi:hypothetical protein Tco_1214089 [Tanacetum coccineum]
MLREQGESRGIGPPTKSSTGVSCVCTYCKNIEGWKPKDLKNKSFVNIQELFDKAMKRVNTFIDYRLSWEDLETLWKLVKAKHGSTRPEEGYERVLWGDLKTMFDPHVEDQGMVVGIKRLHDDLEVTAAKVCVTATKLKLVLLVKIEENILSPDRSTTACKEVEELTKARILRKVKHLTWVANPVMGYHQIQMVEEDEDKTAFFIGEGVFCYRKMPFGLNNAGATYQRLVDKVFHDQIGRN